MAKVLKIFDADTTADLRNPSGDLHLLWGQWAPKVARKRMGFIGGQSPFEEVVEELALRIDGADVDDVLGTNLAVMVELLYQAQAWLDGDDENVVVVSYQPTDSTLTNALQAVVEGYPDAAEWARFAGDFDRLKNNLSLLPATFRFKRRGLWLGVKETPAATAKADNPVVRVASFADFHGTPSPVDIAITGFADDTHLTINPGIILVTNDQGHVVLESTSGMTATNWTSVSDTTFKATNGTILKYTPVSTNESASGSLDMTTTAFDTGEQRVAVFASARVGGADRTFKLRAEGASFVFDDLSATANRTLSRAAYTNPQWLQLGFLHLRNGLKSLRFVASVDSLTNSPTLDIDAVALLVVDKNAYVLSHETGYLSSPFVSGTGDDVDIIVEQRALSERTPFVGYENVTNPAEASLGYEGDAAIYLTGSEVCTLWLSTNVTHWRDTNQSSGAVIQVGMKASRRKGYLTPR